MCCLIPTSITQLIKQKSGAEKYDGDEMLKNYEKKFSSSGYKMKIY